MQLITDRRRAATGRARVRHAHRLTTRARVDRLRRTPNRDRLQLLLLVLRSIRSYQLEVVLALRQLRRVEAETPGRSPGARNEPLRGTRASLRSLEHAVQVEAHFLQTRARVGHGVVDRVRAVRRLGLPALAADSAERRKRRVDQRDGR